MTEIAPTMVTSIRFCARFVGRNIRRENEGQQKTERRGQQPWFLKVCTLAEMKDSILSSTGWR
jgi:hypothetical protein